MDRLHNISFGGGRWGLRGISLILLMGLIAAAVWFIPPNLIGATLGTMTSSKGNIEERDRILPPRGTSGIILTYSCQPWGGAVLQPTERLSSRELARETPGRTCRGLTGALESSEIPMKDLQITRIEKSLLSRSLHFRLKSDEGKRHLHRT